MTKQNSIGPEAKQMVLACANIPKTECGCLQTGKLEMFTYVYLPRRGEDTASKTTIYKKLCDCVKNYGIFKHFSVLQEF